MADINQDGVSGSPLTDPLSDPTLDIFALLAAEDSNPSTTNNFLASDTIESFSAQDTSASDTSSSSTASAASAPLLPHGKLSIAEFSRLVVTRLNAFEQAEAKDNVDLWLQDATFWWDSAALATRMILLRALMTAQSDDENTLYLQQESQLLSFNTNGIGVYNNFLSNTSLKTLNMYNAQVDYKNGTITDAQYYAIATNWNNNLPALNADMQAQYEIYSQAVDALNAQIDQNNAQIDELNTARDPFGIVDDIPHQNHIDKEPYPGDLPSVDANPPPPDSPTIQASIPLLDYVSDQGSVSTVIHVSPLSAAEENYLKTHIQDPIEAINTDKLVPLDSALNLTKTATTNLYNATVAYQNGGDLATYQQAVSDYLSFANLVNPALTANANAYISSVNAYNATINATNKQITIFNKSRVDQEPIPLQILLPVPTVAQLTLPVDIPLGPPPPVNLPQKEIPLINPNAPVGSVTPTNANTFIRNYFNTAMQNVSDIILAYVTKLRLQESYHDYLSFNLKGVKITSANNAFVEHTPELLAGDNPSSTVSGTGLQKNILGLDSKNLPAVISNSLLTAVRENDQIPVPREAISLIQDGVKNVAQKAALAAAFPALALLGTKADLATNGGVVSGAALSLSFVNTINQLVNNNVIGSLTTSALTAAGLSPEAVAKASGPLTAGANLFLLQTALLSVAKELNLQGLITQVLANSSGPSGQSSPFGLNDVLNNPTTGALLKKDLIDQLVGTGNWTQSTAEKFISSALNKIIGRTPFVNNIEFAINLVRGFQAAGFDDATAVKLAAQAQDFVRSEQLVRDKDADFVQKDLNDQALKDDIYQNDDVQSSLQATLDQQDYNTKRDFSDRLIKELTNKDYTLKEARDLSDRVLLSIQSETLKNSFKTSDINADLLKTSIINELTQKQSNTLVQTNTIVPTPPVDTVSAEIAANAAVGRVLNSKQNSELLARENIQQSLVDSGISEQLAATASLQVAILLSNVNPLRESRSDSVLKHQQLADNLSAEITSKLRKQLGIEDATKISDQLVAAILGPANTQFNENEQTRPTSVLNLINDSVSTLRASYHQKANESITDSFNEFRKTDQKLFSFLSETYDPGNNLLLNSAWGLMYNSRPGDKAGAIQV